MTTLPHSERPAPLHNANEYPMLDIPFSVVVDGRHYAGKKISLLGAAVNGLVDRSLDGAEKIVWLTFDFPGFQLTLEPVARVHVEDNNMIMLVFTEPTGDHAPQLRQVLSDWIAGDLTSAGSVIRSSALAEPRGGRPASRKRGVAERLRSGLGTLLVLALTLLLVLIVASLAQARLFTAKIPGPGRVVPAGHTLRAPSDGQISFIDREAPQGEVVFALNTTDGETLSFAMPCDCIALPAGVDEGSIVLAGEPVVTISEPGAPMMIAAHVPQSLLFDLQRGADVEVELADGRSFDARLAPESVPPGAGTPGEPARVLLQPVDPLPEDAAGQLATLSVHRDTLAPLKSAADALDGLASLGEAAWNGVFAGEPDRSMQPGEAK